MNNLKFRFFVRECNLMLVILTLDFQTNEVFCGHSDAGELLLFEFKDGLRMQSTGLRDAYGTEMFEGDVIKTPNNVLGAIVFKAPFFEVTVSKDQSSLYSREWLMQCEVVGNIHENPELLS